MLWCVHKNNELAQDKKTVAIDSAVFLCFDSIRNKIKNYSLIVLICWFDDEEIGDGWVVSDTSSETWAIREEVEKLEVEK